MSDDTEATPFEEIKPPQVLGYGCHECGAANLEVDGPIFQCTGCWSRFVRGACTDDGTNRCLECGGTMKEIAPISCPECWAGTVEEFQAYLCPHCDEVVPIEHWDFHRQEDCEEDCEEDGTSSDLASGS